MRGLLSVWCCAAITLASSQSVAGEDQKTKAHARYDLAKRQMTKSVASIGAPLKKLPREQMASLAAILVITRVVAQSDMSKITAGSEAFWRELDELCPPLPNAPEFKYGDCLDETIAYATAMQQCINKGKAEEQCDREEAGSGSAVVMCRMKQLEDMRGAINRIPGRDWPPGPFPWPVSLR